MGFLSTIGDGIRDLGGAVGRGVGDFLETDFARQLGGGLVDFAAGKLGLPPLINQGGGIGGSFGGGFGGGGGGRTNAQKQANKRAKQERKALKRLQRDARKAGLAIPTSLPRTTRSQTGGATPSIIAGARTVGGLRFAGGGGSFDIPTNLFQRETRTEAKEMAVLPGGAAPFAAGALGRLGTQVLGGAAGGALATLLGDDAPSIGGGGGLFTVGPAGGIRTRRMFAVPHPVTGFPTFFRHVGRPILFSGDLAVCKKVNKVAARARRASPRRRAAVRRRR